MTHSLKESKLGQKTSYDALYSADLLFPIPRQEKRMELGINHVLPFVGFDLWNHYEVSWLNLKGKPVVAIVTIIYPCESPHMIESKSMKLYFNSLNQSSFSDEKQVQSLITHDLSQRVGMPVEVQIIPLNTCTDETLYARMEGDCLDLLDIECQSYLVNPTTLRTSPQQTKETLYSHLLKSNCLITNQPDWASLQISYEGQQIDHEGLLQYIVSFRNHNEFHEQCIERIFMDLMQYCQPQKLAVYGRYTRRGGLDINAYRGTHKLNEDLYNKRLLRQ